VVFGGFGPGSGRWGVMAWVLRLDPGGEGDACDGKADALAPAAVEAADWVAHEQELGEVLAAQSGAAKGLAGAILTLNGNAVKRVEAKIRSFTMRGAGVLPAARSSIVELIHGCHV
jgi:hypothetical protein